MRDPVFAELRDRIKNRPKECWWRDTTTTDAQRNQAALDAFDLAVASSQFYGNVSEMARYFGVQRRTVRNRLQRLGLPKSQYIKRGNVMIKTATVLFVLLAAVASAQTPPVKNPSAIEFTSTDHAQITAYEVDVVRADGTVVQTLTIAASSAVAQPGGALRLTINMQPIAFGAYTFVVRATAGTVSSPNSAASDSWERSPGAPSKPLVK
jgi:hypothetical protein